MDILAICVPLSLAICILFVISGLAIKEYKNCYGRSPWCHESSIAAILGLVVGLLFKYNTGIAVNFDSTLFFYLVLPPIIFSAGFSLKRKQFFRYGVLITMFGIIGTLINFSIISYAAYGFSRVYHGISLSWTQSMLLASVLSASDEVAAMSLVRMKDYPRLGALIFGEGVLNDALSIVLFHALQRVQTATVSDDMVTPDESSVAANLSGTVLEQIVLSSIIGLSCGLVNARFLKLFPQTLGHPVQQTALVLLFGMLAYSIAESSGVSGILTLFIVAVTLAHYSWHSMAKSAQIATKLSLCAMSEIAEGFAFAYVGISLWGFRKNVNFSLVFACYMLAVVLTARLLTILSICWLGSWVSNDFKIPFKEQLGFCLGGVVRGCLCWAQVLQVHNMEILITTTLFIVMTTTLGCGFLLPIIMPRLVPAKAPIPGDAVNTLTPNGLPINRFLVNENGDSANGGTEIVPTNGGIEPKKIHHDPFLIDSDDEDEDHGGGHSLPPSGRLSRVPLSYQQMVSCDESNVPAGDRHRGSTAEEASPPQHYSRCYILWVIFDERIMKHYFGGSATAPARAMILEVTKSRSLWALLCSPLTISKLSRSRVRRDSRASLRALTKDVLEIDQLEGGAGSMLTPGLEQRSLGGDRARTESESKASEEGREEPDEEGFVDEEQCIAELVVDSDRYDRERTPIKDGETTGGMVPLTQIVFGSGGRRKDVSTVSNRLSLRGRKSLAEEEKLQTTAGNEILSTSFAPLPTQRGSYENLRTEDGTEPFPFSLPRVEVSGNGNGAGPAPLPSLSNSRYAGRTRITSNQAVDGFNLHERSPLTLGPTSNSSSQ